MVKIIRNEDNIIVKKSGIIEFLNALGHKIKKIHRKLMKIGPRKTAKIQNISKNELNQAEKLQKNQEMN